jgi:putative endonuclease
MGRTQETGRAAEEAAARFLEARGLQLVERNYRCRRGEIDLVMRDGETVIFVEVRYRRSGRFGSGAESVDGRKQARLLAAALHYAQARGLHASPMRFDVVSVSGEPGQVDWIPDAIQT